RTGMQRRLIGERLACSGEVYRRRDWRDEFGERRTQREDVLGIDDPTSTIDSELIPVDRRCRVARVEPANHAVEPRECVQVGDPGRDGGERWFPRGAGLACRTQKDRGNDHLMSP